MLQLYACVAARAIKGGGEGRVPPPSRPIDSFSSVDHYRTDAEVDYRGEGARWDIGLRFRGSRFAT